MLSHGGFTIFLARPVSLAFLLATLVFLLLPLIEHAVRFITQRGGVKA